MQILGKIIFLLGATLFLPGCSALTDAADLSARTGFEYREEQINNLSGVNATVYHSDQCSLWVFGDDASAASMSGRDFPAVSFSFKGQDVKTGKQVLLLADSSYASCVEPTLNAIFNRTLAASSNEDTSYIANEYEESGQDTLAADPLDSEGPSVQTVEEQEVGKCGGDEVELEVRRVGKTSTIDVLAVNISDIDCFIELGKDVTHLSISDGSSWLWSSGECPNETQGTNNVLLKAHQTAISASYDWDRSQSTGDGCTMGDTGNEALPPGLYFFKAELSSLRLASSNKQFRF